MSTPDYKNSHLVLIGDFVASKFAEVKPFGLVPAVSAVGQYLKPSDILSQIGRLSMDNSEGGGGALGISNMQRDRIKGGVVVLSTGWSNDPRILSTDSDIYKQFRKLEDAGAIAIYVLGVASNYKPISGESSWGNPNDIIKRYSNGAAVKKIPVTFLGGFEGVANGASIMQPPDNYFTENKELEALSKLLEGSTPSNKQVGKPESSLRDLGGNKLNTGEPPSSPELITIEQKLESAKEIIPLLKQRRDIIEGKNNGGEKEIYLSNDLDNALKGVAIQIDTARGLGFPSMGGGTITKEDEALFAKVNDNYLNNYLGYSYPDLNLDVVVRGMVSQSKLTNEQVRALQKIEPTFFIDAQPVVDQKDMEDLLNMTDKVVLDAYKEAANRGFWDKALGIGIDGNSVTEANGEHGFNALLSQKLKEKQYVPVEDEVTNTELGQSTVGSTGGSAGGNSGDGSTSDGSTSTGTNSTYTGEFPDDIKKKIGSLQGSKNINILSGYPAKIRALGDLLARHEGNHPASVSKSEGYANYFDWDKTAIAEMKKSMAGQKGHPGIIVRRPGYDSSAGGLFAALYDVWLDIADRIHKGVGYEGTNFGGVYKRGPLKGTSGRNYPMTIKNQDHFFAGMLKGRKYKGKTLYDIALTESAEKIWEALKKHNQAWTSVPVEMDKAASVQKTHITGRQWIEAYKHLQKFYEGAGKGERAPITQEASSASNTGNPHLNNILDQGNGKMLDVESRNPKYPVSVNINDYSVVGLSFLDTTDPKEQFKNTTHWKVVEVYSANTYLLKPNTSDNHIVLRIKDVITPSTPFTLVFSPSVNTRGGKHAGKASKREEKITDARKGAEDGKFQLFAPEATRIVRTWAKGTEVTIVGDLSRTSNKYVIEASDLKLRGDQTTFSKSIILFGAGFPINSSSYQKELELAKKENRGVWKFQSQSVKGGQPSLAVKGSGQDYYSFVNADKLSSEQLRTIASSLGMKTTAPQIVINEKTAEQTTKKETPAGTPVVVADNVYTADSRPMRAIANFTKKGSNPTVMYEGASAKVCAGFVRRAYFGGTKTGNSSKGPIRISVSASEAPYKLGKEAPYSAYQYHSAGTLSNSGFVQIPASSALMPGDILVVKNWAKSPHGHIQAYLGNGDRWASDYFHGRKVYKGLTDDKYYIALYRDKDFLEPTGVKPLGHNGWETLDKLGQGGVAATSVSISGDDPNYIEEAKRYGVYADLSNYTIEQVEGHKFRDVEVDDSYSVFGMDAKRENHLKKLMHNYNKGLNVCFPVIKAYVVLGNEDDDMLVEGVPLNPPAYYELPPLQSFNLECNNDFNPLDVCVFSCINPSAMRSAMDDMSNLAFSSIPELIGTQWFNPVIANKLNLMAGMKIHIKAGYSNDPNKLVTVFNGIIKETSGNRDFLIQCVCESYAVELLSQQLGAAEPTNFAGNHNASTGLLFGYSMLADNITHFGARLDSKFHFTGAVVGSVVKPLAAIGAGLSAVGPLKMFTALASTGLIGSTIMKYFGATIKESDVGTDLQGTNTEGISYMNTVNGQDGKGLFTTLFGDNIFRGKGRLGDFRDPENKAMIAPISAGNYIWSIFNLSRANLSQRVYANIYASSIESVHGDYRDTFFSRFPAIISFDRKVRYKFYVIRSTIWVVMKEMEYRHPGTLTKPLWYEERQTLFYGTKEQCYIARDLDPMFMNRAGQHSRYNAIEKPYVDFYLKERKKRFDVATGYHYLSTKTNVITSNIKLSRSFATKINSVFYESKWYGGIEGYNEKSDVVLLDKTLAKHEIREKTISLGGIHGSYMAWMYGTQELKKEMESMYDGHIIVTGDPTIKAGDYAYISDTNRGIYGTIKIRECSHHFSPETGYTTIIKPGLFVEATHFMWDDYFVRLNLACSIIDQKVRIGQDTSLQGSTVVESYLSLLRMIGDNRRLGTADYIYNFAGYMAVAGMSWLSVKSLIYTGRKIGLTHPRLKAGTAFMRAYGQVAGKGLWRWSKGLASKYHTRVKNANLRVISQVARSNPALRGNVRNAISLVNKLKFKANMAWAKTIRARSFGSLLLRTSWAVISKLGAVIVAHPIVAIIAAVAGILVSWAFSAVRRMKLLHNAITYFPLYYNGKPYQAGVTGWSGKGQWDAMFDNLKRNARSLDKAARMLENSTNSFDTEGSIKTKTLVGVMNFLAGVASLPSNASPTNNTTQEGQQ